MPRQRCSLHIPPRLPCLWAPLFQEPTPTHASALSNLLPPLSPRKYPSHAELRSLQQRSLRMQLTLLLRQRALALGDRQGTMPVVELGGSDASGFVNEERGVGDILAGNGGGRCRGDDDGGGRYDDDEEESIALEDLGGDSESSGGGLFELGEGEEGEEGEEESERQGDSGKVGGGGRRWPRVGNSNATSDVCTARQPSTAPRSHACHSDTPLPMSTPRPCLRAASTSTPQASSRRARTRARRKGGMLWAGRLQLPLQPSWAATVVLVPASPRGAQARCCRRRLAAAAQVGAAAGGLQQAAGYWQGQGSTGQGTAWAES